MSGLRREMGRREERLVLSLTPSASLFSFSPPPTRTEAVRQRWVIKSLLGSVSGVRMGGWRDGLRSGCVDGENRVDAEVGGTCRSSSSCPSAERLALLTLYFPAPSFPLLPVHQHSTNQWRLTGEEALCHSGSLSHLGSVISARDLFDEARTGGYYHLATSSPGTRST